MMPAYNARIEALENLGTNHMIYGSIGFDGDYIICGSTIIGDLSLLLPKKA